MKKIGNKCIELQQKNNYSKPQVVQLGKINTITQNRKNRTGGDSHTTSYHHNGEVVVS